MSLYQSSVLNKYIATQDTEQVTKAFNKYSNYFLNKEIQQNIRNSKEEQFQEGFLRELFVNVLGYTINPNPDFNLTTELKNIKDAKKTDGAILKADGAALAVIELKGTDTKDLAKVNDQAFNYKNNQPDCVYVITSNFEKLRFFIHNAVEHEEFNLFTLTEERFALLWLFLQKDNLLGDIPAKVKEESHLQEEKITKALYADYSTFKNDLWNDMVEQNSQHEPLLLYKKSQKLLDRFLFIFFSEDKGLLPPNSINVIVEQWTKLKELDEYKPLYDRFKKYFGYMNDGYKGAKYEIHAYNGGLFKEDELLDSLLIDDALLEKHCLKLTNYDFADEVDTNILGHIFEHSLNDIENVRAQLEGEEVEKSKTKRKKDGVFYTPKYITKYIVDNTVGKLCQEKKAEIGIDDEEFAKDRKGRRKDTIKKLDAQLKLYREWLLQITICDPACGSGAFLNQALEFLMAEHRYVDELEAQLFDGSIVFPDVENHILENNIHGVDINEESVEIARLSLWLRTAKKGRKLTSLSSNIKCGNSLIDDPEVAGELAFNWQEQFPKVFAKGGFDVVIGNPPYVVRISASESEYFRNAYETTQGKKYDLFRFFIERGLKLLSAKASLGFITPDVFLHLKQASNLRRFIIENYTLSKVLHAPKETFDASVESVLFIIEKPKIPNSQVCFLDLLTENLLHEVNQDSLLRGDNNIDFAYQKNSGILDKINEIGRPIGESMIWKKGLGVYSRQHLALKFTQDEVNEIMKTRPWTRDYKVDETFGKEIGGKDVFRYDIEWNGTKWLSYGPWLAFQRPIKFFEGPRLLVREITSAGRYGVNATYVEDQYYNNQSMFNGVLKDDNNKDDLKFVLGMLNSKLYTFYILATSPKSDRKLFPTLLMENIELFPIVKDAKEAIKNEITELVSSAIATAGLLRQSTKNLVELMDSSLNIETPSTKLKHWPSLDFKGFLSELKKAKVPNLSLDQEAEWMEYFHKKKAEANALQSEIDRIDKEIDQMVYKLYGLTEEEIWIVERNDSISN